MYGEYQIRELPLSLGRMRARMEAFLAENGLRAEPVDRYVTVTRGDGEEILAGGGLAGDIIKGIAVSERARGDNLTGPLVSRLLEMAEEAGHTNVKVYTKPENEAVFVSLGFHAIGRSPGILLLENGRGLEEYGRRLAEIGTPDLHGGDRSLPADGAAAVCRPLADDGRTVAADGRGRTGVIVMNADPMTLGHKYLIEQAAARTERLYVIVLGGDRSRFSAEERFRIAASVCRAASPRVRAVEGGDYCISPATFPSYFLKRKDEAAEQQMRLDLDLFARHIAPALGASVRFVGSEPLDPMTARYNELMRELLPQHGIEVIEIERLALEEGTASADCMKAAGGPCAAVGGQTVSASTVRRCLDALDGTGAMRLCPPQTWPFLLGDLAVTALRMELEVPGKPGMVCPDSRGSHEDMDAALMLRSIAALRPWFMQLGMAGMAEILSDGGPDIPETGTGAGSTDASERLAARVREIGLQAESAMLRATGGVNTHRGALFALGLMVAAAGRCLRADGGIGEAGLRRQVRRLAEGLERLQEAGPRTEMSHGAVIVRQHGVKGAFRMALDGYREVFEDWLPYWQTVKKEPYGPQKTLLRILSSLDDTCVVHRVGIGRARSIQAEAAALLADFSPEKLQEMNVRFVSERVSPGGSADMLALTMLTGALINNNKL